MSDKLYKVMSKNKEVRAYVAITTDLVNEARTSHNMKKTATAALGRTLTANAILGADLKNFNDSISIQIRTEGPIGNILCYSNSKCEVKGYVTNPQIDLPLREDGKINVGGAVTTNGTLNIIKDIGMKEPYHGTIPLVSGEIAEDLTYYFAKSEQIPTAFALGVLMDKDGKVVLSSGGVLIQLMPNASDETVNQLELKLNGDFSISKLLADEKTPNEIIEYIFGEIEFQIVDEIEPKFVCDCSKNRFFKGIVSLGVDEIDSLISANEDVETVCHFCNEKYVFSISELKEIRKMI